MGQTIFVIIVIVALIILGAWSAVDGANKRIDLLNKRIDLFRPPSLITPVPELIISNRPKYFMKRIDNDEVVAVYGIDKGMYGTTVLVYTTYYDGFPPSWKWKDINLYKPID